MRLIFCAVALILAQDIVTSYECPSGYQSLSDDPNLTCSNSLRISRACSMSSPCEIERCAEICEEHSDCSWFFHNSRNVCQLFHDCDVQRVATNTGATCGQKQLTSPSRSPSYMPTQLPSRSPSYMPTQEPTRSPSFTPTQEPSKSSST